MSKHAAIKATFSDLQLVKTRKLAKLIFELPIDEADEALDVLGGLPRSDRERWVGITLLDMKLAVIATVSDEVSHRAFCDLPFPQQAGIKSNDTTFQLWMSVHHNVPGVDCAGAIRNYCGVNSRANILPGTPAGDKWRELLRAFENYR